MYLGIVLQTVQIRCTTYSTATCVRNPKEPSNEAKLAYSENEWK